MSDKQEEKNKEEQNTSEEETKNTEETQEPKEGKEVSDAETKQEEKKEIPDSEDNTKDSETEEKKEEKDIPDASELKPGMTVRVYQKIKELNMKKEEKERIQYFEGIIIAKKHNTEAGGSITVHRVVNGIGVEKIFPLNLPTITRIEIKKQAKVRRSKLYFLKRGYKKRLKEKKVS